MNEKSKQEAEESLDKMVTDKGIILGCHEGFCYDEVTDFMAEFAEPREKRIAELEKENAELKKSLRDNKKCHCMVYLNYKDLESNLTKAKELIKYLLSFIQKENYKTRWDINIAEAEQFISEVEK